MKKSILPNGLSFYHYPIIGSRSICIGMYVNTGSRYENTTNNGISHLLEHMHFRRLDNMTQRELYYETDIIGSTMMASTYKDFTRYYMKVRPKYVRKSIEFFAKILVTNNWTDTDLAEEKAVVVNQILEKQEYISIDQYRDALLWKDNTLAYPIMGEVDTVKRMVLCDLLEFKETFYKNENVAIVITGELSDEDLSYITERLSMVTSNSNTVKIGFVSPHICSRKPDICFANYASNYLDVSVSFDVNNKINFNVLTLLNSMLGGGTSSQLQQVIREKKGLSSNIYSEIEEYADVAVINISFSVAKKFFYETMRTIVRVICSLKRSVSPDDMATNLPFYTDNLWFLLEDTETLNLKLGWEAHVKGYQQCGIENEIDSFAAISQAELEDAAKSIFVKKNASVVVLGSVSGLTKKEVRQILSILG